MNDEALVCEVGWDSIRFHYAHHDEIAWEVRLIDDVLVDVRGYPMTGVERPLTEDETSALLAAHLAIVHPPRDFEIPAGAWLSMVVWLAVGFLLGLLVFSGFQ